MASWRFGLISPGSTQHRGFSRDEHEIRKAKSNKSTRVDTTLDQGIENSRMNKSSRHCSKLFEVKQVFQTLERSEGVWKSRACVIISRSRASQGGAGGTGRHGSIMFRSYFIKGPECRTGLCLSKLPAGPTEKVADLAAEVKAEIFARGARRRGVGAFRPSFLYHGVVNSSSPFDEMQLMDVLAFPGMVWFILNDALLGFFSFSFFF